jgi:hypothetical protein
VARERDRLVAAADDADENEMKIPNDGSLKMGPVFKYVSSNIYIIWPQ